MMYQTERDKETDRQTGYPSIDKPWLKYYSSGSMDDNNVSKTVYQYVVDNNKDNADDTALIFKGKKISFSSMLSNTAKVGNSMMRYGLTAGDRIMVAATGIPETIYILLACSKLGICAEMINFSLDSRAIKNQILSSDAKLVFCLDRIHEKIKTVIKEKEIDTVVIPAVQTLSPIIRLVDGLSHRIDKTDGRTISYADFLTSSTSFDETIVSDEGQPYIVVYSSGTTGVPKGIVHTNRSYTSMAEEYRLCEYPFERGDIFLNQIPFFIASALSFLTLAPIMLGVSVMLEPKYEIDVWLKDIKKYKPKVIFGTQSFWNSAVDSEETIVKDLSFATIAISGGEPISIESENKVNEWLESKKFGSKLTVGYGMSELNGTITTSSAKYHNVGATGIPLPDVVVSVFDTYSGQEMKYGELGEIMVQSPCAMKEYSDIAKTVQYWWKDSKGRLWAKTGDVGMVDENGEVYVYGRATDSKTESGKTIYYFEIENKVRIFDWVKKCKVVETEKGILRINIVTSKNTPDNAHKELMTEIQKSFGFCNDKIQIKVWKEFPLNANGKVDIFRLKKD